jgi:hypothetical protein
LVLLLHSGFTGEIEFDYVALNLDVPGPQSRQTKTSIFTRINLASGSQETGGKDPQHRGHHRLSPQAWLFDMRRDSRAQFRERFGKLAFRHQTTYLNMKLIGFPNISCLSVAAFLRPNVVRRQKCSECDHKMNPSPDVDLVTAHSRL